MLLWLSISVLSLAGVGQAAQIAALSFGAPYTTLNSQGERQVGKSWRSSGTTAVHENFARLTPDRQSKKGAIWATKGVGASEVSVALKFRISGQGKKYFGDGMALWLTDSRSYRPGDFHGATDKFKGIGVIIDTFKNSEMLSYHKDITVVINQGNSEQEELLAASIGCNGDVRYHEERGDFSVSSASRVKFVVEEADDDSNRLALSVYLDASNSGNYKECVAATMLPETLDVQWLSRAYLGITASTGQLADNHDVLSLSVFSDKQVHSEVETSDEYDKKLFPIGEGINEERFVRIETGLHDLLSKIDHLKHHLEHEMVAVDDHVRTTIDKLAKQEQQAEDRIEALEESVKEGVEESLTARISTLERAMRDAVQSRVKAAEKNTLDSVHDVVGKQLKNAGSGSWTYGFIFLVIVDIVAAVLVYKWYVKFKKSHLL